MNSIVLKPEHDLNMFVLIKNSQYNECIYYTGTTKLHHVANLAEH